MRGLSTRTVIVSGAASGIGLATAAAAVRAGAKTALLDRDAPAVTEAARRLGPADGVVPVVCDVTQRDQVEAALETVTSRWGAVHGVVSSAGVETGAASHLVELADWRRTLDINLTGTFLLCQAVLRAHDGVPRGEMPRDGMLSIVCVSSPAAFVGFAAGENAAYSASKGGVSALVRTLAVEYARRGVRVNAVVPGATETPLMWAKVPEAEVAAVRREVEQAVPLGRLADPAEIADAILWLLSEDSRYVTGSHLVCDGGLLAKAAITV